MSLPHKIKLGISSCLLGDNVRYDGGNRLDQDLLDAFGSRVEWIPFCPEVEAGLSVPREPMRLVLDNNRIRLITIESQQDRTDLLVRWANEKAAWLKHEHIHGLVLKSRSPSCGIHDAELCSPAGVCINKRPGLFAEAVMIKLPYLALEDEERLQDPRVRKRFLNGISADR
jgi:uncharacterized protein YbbK (DUF523 family)